MEFKKYNHKEEEKRVSDFWINKGLFKPRKTKLKKKIFQLLFLPQMSLVDYIWVTL